MSETEFVPGRAAVPAPASPRIMRRVFRLVASQPLGAIGLFILAVLIVCAVFASVIATHPPVGNDIPNRFQPPSSEHWFGTDNFGRDLFSRVIHGSRTSLLVGIITVLTGMTGGALLGIVSAYYSRFDIVVQRMIDAMLAIPNLLFAIAIVAVLGASLTNTIIAISIAFVPSACRVLRSQALSIRQQPYVDAARATGASDLRVIIQHIIPNCGAPYIILASTGLATAILVEASLSFLGLGTPPPRPSWGQMLSGSVQQYASTAPWLAIFPGLAITLVVLGINLFGDALRDLLDPRLRGSR